MIIYKITNKENGKVYIGQTIRELDVRMKEHLRHNKTYIDRALNKYGIDAFEVEVIDECDNSDELNDKEKYWIKYYDCICPNGYNLCEGGGQTNGYHHTEEAKQKMSKSKSELYLGENNPFYGKKHSDETKEKFKNRNYDFAKKKVICIEDNKIFNSVKECAEYYDAIPTHITRVCKHKRKHTKGLTFMYYDEYMTIPCQA